MKPWKVNLRALKWAEIDVLGIGLYIQYDMEPIAQQKQNCCNGKKNSQEKNNTTFSKLAEFNRQDLKKEELKTIINKIGLGYNIQPCILVTQI